MSDTLHKEGTVIGKEHFNYKGYTKAQVNEFNNRTLREFESAQSNIGNQWKAYNQGQNPYGAPVGENPYANPYAANPYANPYGPYSPGPVIPSG